MARSIAISGHFHIWLISTVHKIVPQDLVDIRLNRKSTKPHSVHAHMNELKTLLSNIKASFFIRLPTFLDYLGYWRTIEKLVLKSRAVLSARAFSTSRVGYNNAGKLIENVVYCFYEIILENICLKKNFDVILWRSRYLFSLHSSDDERKPINAAELE